MKNYLHYTFLCFLTVFTRRHLGPDLEVVVLEMTLEEQMERIKSRHDGNDNAVQMMKVLQYFRKVF